jgi:hypothetical protein
MRRPDILSCHHVLAVVLILMLAACTATPCRHESFDEFDIEARAITQQKGGFEGLYQASEVREVDPDGLRIALRDMSCCASNRDGTGQGKPVNVVLVAAGREVLQSLIRAGWTETSYEKDDNCLNNINYLFGRPPDAVFGIVLWVSPKPVLIDDVDYVDWRMPH